MTVVVKGIKRPPGTDVEVIMEEGNGAGGGGSTVLQNDLDISSAQILNMFSNPVILVPTPAADQVVLIKNLVLHYIFGGTPYATNTRLFFPYLPFTAGSMDAIQGINNFFSQPADQILIARTLEGSGPIVNFQGKAVGVSVQNGNPVGGNGSVKLTCEYILVTVPS